MVSGGGVESQEASQTGAVSGGEGKDLQGGAGRGSSGGGRRQASKGEAPSAFSPPKTASAHPYFEDDTEPEEEEVSTDGTPSPAYRERKEAEATAMEEGLTETTERVAASQKERIFDSMISAVVAADSVRTTGNVAFSAGSYQNALTLYSVALRHLEEARKLQTGGCAATSGVNASAHGAWIAAHGVHWGG